MIKQLISLIIWIKSTSLSLDSSLTSTFYQSITTIDSNDTTDYSGQNLMYKTNDKIRIRENAKVTQHDPDFENANDKEHLEAPHRPIIAVNAVKNNARICQRLNVLKGYTRSRPRYSFTPLDSNCPK